MTPQEAVDRFYALLVEHFHHGHERALLDRAFRQVRGELSAPEAGKVESRSEIPVIDCREAFEKWKAAYQRNYGEQFIYEFAFQAFQAAWHRQPEPVSSRVSLESCAQALFDDLAHEDFEECHRDAKTVLEAAGVKYAD